ncbi:MAG: sigma-54 dependent transcriptional regulator [Syntrophobacterales bacterium]|nr:sigma-54 dependent transcriptional regulator [Syntrophobacterales bacterium]
MAKILVVDDDPQLRKSFERILSSMGHSVKTVPTAEMGISVVQQNIPDLVIMDVRLPGMNGLEAFEEIKKIEPRLPVIIMTAYGTTDTAIEATKRGAFDYILKPFDIPVMLKMIEQALKAGKFMRSRVAVDAEPGRDYSSDALIGRSSAMQEIFKAIGRVAPTDATVLIRGESGTGKELVARAVYQHSARADKPFLVINCVAIPETLLESELFGYEKGAFTGAHSRRIGKVEQAHGGTIFLDEIGDMPLSIQAKLLRLLQEKSVERLGGRQPIPVDVRIIAATNRDLESAVSEGRFRSDLYYRLKVVTLELPPLRERREDIGLLADYFLAKYSAEMGIPNPGITSQARALMEVLDWPGNVRELANTIRKVLIFNRGMPITREELAEAVGQSELRDGGKDIFRAKEWLRQWIRQELLHRQSDHVFDDLISEIEAEIIRQGLEITGGNRSQASKLLGLSRPTLIARMEKYGIKVQAQISSED